MKRKIMIIVSIAVLLIASVSADLFAEGAEEYDPALKAAPYELQATQPESEPYAYFYQVAAKMNIDVTGLTDDEVAMKVKQAEVELAEAEQQNAGTMNLEPVYDAAGNFVVASDSIEMAKKLLAEMGIDSGTLSDEEIFSQVRSLQEYYVGYMSDAGIDAASYPWFDVILKGWYTEQQANMPPSDPYDYFYQVAAKMNIDVTGLTDDEVAAKVKQAEVELAEAEQQNAGTMNLEPGYDAAGNFIVTSDSIEMAKGVLMQIGVDIQLLGDDEAALRIQELHEHYLGIMADAGIDMRMVPWIDVILKGFYYEQQP